MKVDVSQETYRRLSALQTYGSSVPILERTISHIGGFRAAQRLTFDDVISWALDQVEVPA
jgi:hypothetical protein